MTKMRFDELLPIELNRFKIKKKGKKETNPSLFSSEVFRFLRLRQYSIAAAVHDEQRLQHLPWQSSRNVL